MFFFFFFRKKKEKKRHQETKMDDCRWLDSMNPFRNWGEKAEREKEQNLMDLKTHWEVPCWKHGRFRALWGGRIRGIFKVRFEAKASKLSPYTAKRSDDQEVGEVVFVFLWEEQWVYTCIFIIIFTYIDKSNSVRAQDMIKSITSVHKFCVLNKWFYTFFCWLHHTRSKQNHLVTPSFQSNSLPLCKSSWILQWNECLMVNSRSCHYTLYACCFGGFTNLLPCPSFTSLVKSWNKQAEFWKDVECWRMRVVQLL